MKFYSTNDLNHVVDLKTAVVEGLAPEGGLYLPVEINPLSQNFWQHAANLSLPEISNEIAKQLVTDSIPAPLLEEIVYSAINFDAPVVQLDENLCVLELFHGPTLAFKDFGARFMAQIMSHYMQGENKELNVLVATSGDTGGAVASGFFKALGVKVILLYPKDKVSFLQEQQLTTMGENITALQVHGTFDDCQSLVKAAFMDSDLRSQFLLSSANSINIARLIPQSFYYAKLAALLNSKKLIVSVPSGNFGNLTAGVIAKILGAPISKFIAATNSNDIVPQYLTSGDYQPKASVQTISNAMDVGDPSNFQRLSRLFKDSLSEMRATISGFSVTEEQTKNIMIEEYQRANYVLDPHGAVGLHAIKQFIELHGSDFDFSFLETAHPAKFIDVVEKTLATKIKIPTRLAELEDKESQAIPMNNSYQEFRDFLTSSL